MSKVLHSPAVDYNKKKIKETGRPGYRRSTTIAYMLHSNYLTCLIFYSSDCLSMYSVYMTTEMKTSIASLAIPNIEFAKCHVSHLSSFSTFLSFLSSLCLTPLLMPDWHH